MIDKAAHHADTHPSTATESVDAHHAEVKKTGVTGARFALFIAILSLFFTAIGVAAGYKHWQRMNDKVGINNTTIKQIKEQLNAAPNNDALETLRKELDDKTAQSQANHAEALQEMARMQNQTRQFADSVASQVEQVTFLQARIQQTATPTTAKEWQVAEVHFLLQMANRELHLARNSETAKASLKEADTLLATLGLVDYLPVRQQITRDIAALDASPAPDIAGIAQRIHALMLELKPLPVAANAEPVPVFTNSAPQPDGDGSLWAEYKGKALAALNDAVVIRRADQPLQSALDADARQHLFQLLHLRLESLRLLVLQRDNPGFHAQIALLHDTLQAYYPEAQAKPLLEALAELDKNDINPVLPDISTSLKQLESARQAENAKTPPPVTPPAAAASSKPPAKGGKSE